MTISRSDYERLVNSVVYQIGDVVDVIKYYDDGDSEIKPTVIVGVLNLQHKYTVKDLDGRIFDTYCEDIKGYTTIID